MLRELGFKTMAYDWRDKNIPEFDVEIVLKRNLEGLKQLLNQVEDFEALKSYD